MKVVSPPTPSTMSLAPGFGFYPTDQELVGYYLQRKICGKPFPFQVISEINVYEYEPWKLAEFSLPKSKDLELYFFTPKDKRYENCSHLKRATVKGYWRSTGKDRPVHHQHKAIGMKRTLVFHSDGPPDGINNNWVMHEYRLMDNELEKAAMPQNAFVLCKIFKNSDVDSSNMGLYAPLVEERANDLSIHVPAGETKDETCNYDEAQVGDNFCFHLQDKRSLLSIETPPSHSINTIRKREISDEDLVSHSRSRRTKNDDACSSHVNVSEDSAIKKHEHPPPINMDSSKTEDEIFNVYM